jgi:hypothetical protein
VQDRRTDFLHEWIALTLPLLCAADMNNLAFPIDVLKTQMTHLAASQTVHSDKQ